MLGKKVSEIMCFQNRKCLCVEMAWLRKVKNAIAGGRKIAEIRAASRNVVIYRQAKFRVRLRQAPCAVLVKYAKTNQITL